MVAAKLASSNAAAFALPPPKSGASLIVSWALAGRSVLVVGGSDLAASRASYALESDAFVYIVAPSSHISKSTRQLIDKGDVVWHDRSFDPRDLDAKAMVFVTDGDSALSRQIVRHARQRRVPVNASDLPELSDFWFTSTYRDHALQVAISTNGNAPNLASRLRKTISAALDPCVGRAVHRLGIIRQRIRDVDPHPSSGTRRQAFVNRICEDWPLQRLADITDEEVDQIVDMFMDGQDYVPFKKPKGIISIVGAGTGDPDLLTRGGHRAITTADVVIADKFVPKPILAMVTGELIVVDPEDYSQIENELEHTALRAIESGKDVARLVIGDPFLFSNAFQDAAFFRRYGYEPNIIPGIATAFQANILAKVPGAVHGSGDQLLVVPSLSDKARPASIPQYVAWRTVVLCGNSNEMSSLSDQLVKKGYPADLPVSIVFINANHSVKTTVGNLLVTVKRDFPHGAHLWLTIGHVVKSTGEPLAATGQDSWLNENLDKSNGDDIAFDLPAYSRTPPRQSLAIPERRGDVKYVTGSIAAAHVAYGFSDLSFVYPFLPNEHLETQMNQWVTNSVGNLKNQIPDIRLMQTRSGAAGAVYGALKAGASVTVVASSQALPVMTPIMHQIARERLPSVFHVVTERLDRTDTIIGDYSDVMGAAYTGFALLCSNSVQEVHDMGIIAHIASVLSNTPVLHFFDGTRIARETNRVQLLGYDVLKKITDHVVAQHQHTMGGFADSLEVVMKHLQPIFNYTYKPFEYSGAEDAEHVVIAMGPVVSLVEQAVNHLVASGKSVGLLKIRLYRPWSAKHLLAALPRSVQRIAVVDQSVSSGGHGHGPLFLDVTSGFYGGDWEGPVPVIVNCKVQPGSVASLSQLHPLLIESLFENLTSPRPVINYNLQDGWSTNLSSSAIAECDAKYIPQKIKQAIFWDVQDRQTEKASKLVVDVLTHRGALGLQSYTVHAASQLEPISATHLRFGPTLSSALQQQQQQQVEYNSPHLISSADYVACHAADLVKSYNVIASLRKGGSLLINCPWPASTLSNPEELQAELPLPLQSLIIEKNIQVYALDVDTIAQNFTLFHGDKSDFAAFILAGLFFRVLGDASGVEGLLERMRGVEENLNVVQLKVWALERAFEKVGRISTEVFAKGVRVEGARANGVRHQQPEQQRQSGGEEQQQSHDLPAYLNGTTPFIPKIQFAEDSDDSEADGGSAQVVPAHAAQWPFLFPEAYSMEQSLRPDIDEEGGAFVVNLTENKRLTPETYDRNVFHMEMDITGTGLKYDIGEALGVHGHNDLEEVKKFLDFYGLGDGRDVVSIERRVDSKKRVEVRTVSQIFTQLLDIFGKPGKKFYQSLMHYAKDPKERLELAHLISTEGAEDFRKLSEEETVTYAGLLERFPSAHPSVSDLIRLVPHIKPRHYSIASSMNMHPDSVHLLVVLVNWTTPSGASRTGQCTRYLSQLPINSSLVVTIKSSVMKLPPSPMQPVIMAGLGTGMAPFRAFIEERAYQKSLGIPVGPMILYFGSRHRAMEYLYGEELEAYHADGTLTHLRLAFSRDQKKKVYIQHKLDEDSEVVKEYMLEREGAFYLCGPTWPVPDVKDALVKAFGGVLGKVKAEEYLEDLKEEERYILEVY
ncbi:hypothetical protein HK102_001940 [Quaeritorhiza haematococci]|nr:hypothetical protein HK102_001940 [Quaeritorhiza haematococci]